MGGWGVAGEVYIIYGLMQERKPHSEKGRFAQEISGGPRVSFSLRSQSFGHSLRFTRRRPYEKKKRPLIKICLDFSSSFDLKFCFVSGWLDGWMAG